MRVRNVEQWIKAQALTNRGWTPNPKHAAPAPSLTPARGRRGVYPAYRKLVFAIFA